MTSIPGKDTKELLSNPYDVGISLLIPSISYDGFMNLYNSLLKTCSNPNDVEILVKIDDINHIESFYSLSKISPFKFKILMYPQYNGRFTLHHFFNDLGAISSGKIIWTLNDDAEIVSSGDWYKPLMDTRNSFADNIYCILIPFNNGKGMKQLLPTPAFTREWHKMCGKVTQFPNYDRWIQEMSKRLGRQILLSEDDIVVTMPKGHRVLSKYDRKNIFYPKFEKILRKLNKRLRK